MHNPFLSGTVHDTHTAMLLENAVVTDIGNAVAYTNGKKIYINTEENLRKILPAYDNNMLKWLLWHEKMHMKLSHHKRFFDYISELVSKCESANEFTVGKEEVNIIMDILVHDSMSKMFPELVPTAEENLAQFRDRNSLGYTFTTDVLEDMLDEYNKYKDKGKGKDKEGPSGPSKDGPSKDGHGGGTSTEEPKDKGKRSKDTSEDKDTPTEESETESSKDKETSTDGRHKDTDWSKLKDRDSTEFIDDAEAYQIDEQVEKLKRKKIKQVQLIKTMGGLITGAPIRSYKTPNYAQTGQHTILKGHRPARASLYLCFDASGSMQDELDMFKEIITKSIPQAMDTPCLWFSGYDNPRQCLDPDGRVKDDYYKGKYKDFINTRAGSGYCDDGERTIELCLRAEQLGYSPIGITDGGRDRQFCGTEKDLENLKKLKRTILLGPWKSWLKSCKELNPSIEIITIDEDDI